MPASPTATPERIREANTTYHDAAAHEYDAKWGIDYGPGGQKGVTDKLAKALGERPGHYPRALEIGAGTGYFSLNLMQAGVIGHATATDISPGMLEVLERSARLLGLDVDTRVTDAEQLPFADDSFDLVIGHAVLHHIPDLARAFAEFARVLRPGGVVAFCGEPSARGDALAELPKRVAMRIAPLWRRAVGAGPRPERHGEDAAGHALEWEVDVHSFEPGELRELMRAAGFVDDHIRGEELVANLYGWWLRTLESTADPKQVPVRWQLFAFHSYATLQRLDTRLLEPRLPPEVFYNLVLSARVPG